MALVEFFDIRQCDPVSALVLKDGAVAYGTYVGRICYYHLGRKVEKVLAEYSPEAVRGLYVSSDFSLYASIGDRHGLIVSHLLSAESPTRIINYERQHTMAACPYQQALLYKDTVCIVPIEPVDCIEKNEPEEREVYVMNLESMMLTTAPHEAFKRNSVVFDFDGTRILWVENTSQEVKTLKVSFMSPDKDIVILQTAFRRRITAARLLPQEVVYIRDFRHIFLSDLEGTNDREELGVSDSDILAMSVFPSKDLLSPPDPNARIYPINPDTCEIIHRVDSANLLVLTLEAAGRVVCWNSRRREVICDLLGLQELRVRLTAQDLFSMGYPYFLAAEKGLVAISTDQGVFIISSEKLAGLID